MEQNKRISELLKNTIGQRYDAMALKMVKDESEVPDNALCPKRDLGSVPAELVGCFNIIFYNSAEDAVFKALGVE